MAAESFIARLQDKAGARVDLALTLPLFLIYHLGVVFLDVQNAADWVTGLLLLAANGSREAYLGMTAAIGAVFVGAFTVLGRSDVFRASKFAQIAIEGIVYALLMRFGAAFIVGQLFAGPLKDPGPFVGIVMSLGAGFYEELAFRVILFGLGSKLILWLMKETSLKSFRRIGLLFLWALVASALFSGVHYIGVYSDPFKLSTFIFRMILGLALTLIFTTRGFAAAVWSHAFYDVWVLVL